MFVMRGRHDIQQLLLIFLFVCVLTLCPSFFFYLSLFFSEVPFVFNVWDDEMEQTPPVKLTDNEVALDNQIISAWMNMVKFGNPNGDGKNGDPVKSPGYAAYDSSNRVTILDYPDNR